MALQKTLLPLTLLILSNRALSATIYLPGKQARQNSSSPVSISLVNGIPLSRAMGAKNAGKRKPHEPPGEETDPPGVRVYDTLDAVPTARLLSLARRRGKCYAKRRGGAPRCWKAYVCGLLCEQILLAVDGYCRRGGGCGGGGCGRWRRCKKARKFHRCFTRVCYRGGGVVGRPRSWVDRENVAIVRYRRPPPRHEVLARINGQSSTQSAIFK